MHQAVDRLTSRARIDAIAELAGMDSEPAAQGALLRAHVPVGLVVVHGEHLQGDARAGFGHVPGFDDRSLEPPAELCRKRSHTQPYDTTKGPCLIFSSSSRSVFATQALTSSGVRSVALASLM